MHTTVQSVYQDGVVRLVESTAEAQAGAPVLVTFLSARGVDLRERWIGVEEAAELRARLSAFAEDWDGPEMSVYDNYHAAKSRL